MRHFQRDFASPYENHDRYKSSDIDMLVEGTLPQRRVLDLAPGIGDIVGSDGREHLARIIESSLEY